MDDSGEGPNGHPSLPYVLCIELVLRMALVCLTFVFLWRCCLTQLFSCASEFNDFNNAFFNIRARSLNNLVYWLAQIVGSITIGTLLDQRALSRRTRAFSGWIILFLMTFVVHIWAYFYQK